MIIQQLPKWSTRRPRRPLVIALLTVLGVVAATASSAPAAPGRPSSIEGFARFGDCAQRLEGDTCHFLSLTAQRHFVQVEVTTTTMTAGREVYDRDILCKV